jgi:hypothetical protein
MDEKTLAQIQAKIDELTFELASAHATILTQNLEIAGLRREILLKRMDQNYDLSMGLSLH